MNRTNISLYLRDLIYGGIDGSVTTFAVVAGVRGAGLSSEIILIMGTASLVGDGFSMAASNFLAARAERQRLSATQIETTGPQPHPLIAASATFVSFITAGIVALVPFAATAMGMEVDAPFVWSTGLTAAVFFAVGAGKSLVLPVRWWIGGLESLAVGGAASALAYACGGIVGGLAGAT